MSRLDRFLNLFTEVRRGESISALLLALNIFVILTAYYVLKPVREALILAGAGGAEIKSYSSAGQVLLLLIAVPLYARFASRFPRRVLINRVTVFFALCLVAFYALAIGGAPIGVVFYLWVGIFNLMVPAQFWAFANDVYTPESGKRLFVIVAFGASTGAVVGSVLAAELIDAFGLHPLLLISAGLLLASLTITHLVDRREQPTADHSGGQESLGQEGAFRLLIRNRYLLIIAFMLLVLNWVNSTGEYILGRLVKEAAEAGLVEGVSPGASEGEFIGHFYAEFYAVVNVLGLLLQLFVVSRVLKHLGVRFAILILPVIAMGGYLIAALYPLIGVLRWAKVAENATDYSLQNTVQQVLYLPTSREEKYKAKQAIDTLFVRSGDVLSAVLVFVGTSMFALSTQQFALVNVALASVWLALSLMAGTRYRTLAGEQGSSTLEETVNR